MRGGRAGLLFGGYQVGASVVVLPAAYSLWHATASGGHPTAAAIVILPVVFGYVVPGIGTNVLGLWEFRAGIRLGRYTLLHGLMFGGAASLLLWLAIGPHTHPAGLLGALVSFHAGAVTLGFWNWAFDTLAVATGLAVVRNKPYAEGRSAAAITADYAPVYFGTFGGAYGLTVYLLMSSMCRQSSGVFWATAMSGTVGCMVLPVATHGVISLMRHGYWGFRPYVRGEGE